MSLVDRGKAIWARIQQTHAYRAWHRFGEERGNLLAAGIGYFSFFSMFPAAALAENSSPELLKAVRAFADTHDLGYTIHLSQSTAEVAYVRKHHGVSPVGFLARHDFLSSRLFAAHCRYVDDADIAAVVSAFGTRAVKAATWAEWEAALGAEPTPLLVLMPHNDDGQGALEVAGEFLIR